MKHLTDIKNLKREEIDNILNLAKDFQEEKTLSRSFGKHLMFLFFEPSTRTRFSFEMAANKLGIHVYNFATETNNLVKGESLKDAVENLYEIGMNGVVIRHPEAGIVDDLVNELPDCPISCINAGDGQHTHPTQALLDLYTMQKHLGNLTNKKIAIIGDIRHSRVAHANVSLLKKYGAEICLCAPDYFKEIAEGITSTQKLEDALKDADVIMSLRVQKERLEDRIPIFDYIHDYGITLKKLKEFAKPNVLLMHPGPVNRDVEISSEVLDGEYGKIILEQAHNGVFVRMAVLDLLLGS